MKKVAGMANVDFADFYYRGEGLAPREQWEFGHGSAWNLVEGWRTIVYKLLILKGEMV